MSATPPAPPIGLTLKVDWTAADDLPVMASNVFLIQQTGQEFLLTFGSAVPPTFEAPPTPEQLANLRTIKARPIVRMALTPGRIVELLQNLQQQIAAYYAAQSH
jgi:hypothetical protein